MRILLAEDERSLSRALCALLEKNNYGVDAVYNGTDALAYLESGGYDCAILDIMMPGLDGITVLKRARASGCTLPIIMLTAKSETDDKVLGLDSGANDYLTKPFDSKELLARIRAATRMPMQKSADLSFGNVTLSRHTFELYSAGGRYRLAKKEFQMMEMLLQNPNMLVSTEQFMEKIWGFDSESEINVVWVYISYLRKKLSALGANIEIKTSRGLGFYLGEKK